jgi:hypothetical protein
MSLTPTQLSELQTIVEAFRGEFPNSDDAVWQAAIRIQKGGLGPVSGAGGQAAFDIALAEIVVCADQISTVQGRQGGPGSSLDEAVFQVVPVEDNFPAGALGDVLYLDMAPNIYLATGVISIVPAGPNSVTLAEIGTDVARTVPAASGGLEINNLSTGAGFERVLTTADSQAHNAEFVTMSLSANIPNERVLVAGAGMSLTDGGAGGNVTLDVDAPNVVGSVENQTLRWDVPNQQYEPTSTVLINPLTPPIGGRIQVQGSSSSDVQRSMINVDVGNSVTAVWSTERALDGFYSKSDLTGPDLHEWGRWTNALTTGVRNFRITEADEFIFDFTAFFVERAAALGSVLGRGQFWVRDDAPNIPMFTDDVGTDFELLAAAPSVTFDLLANINTSTPPTEAVTGNFRILDAEGVDVLMTLGFNASQDLVLENFIRNGEFHIEVVDSTGAVFRVFEANPVSATEILGDRAVNIVAGGRLFLNANGFSSPFDLALYHNDIETCGTLALLDGGFQVNNDYNGGSGSERVLTASDVMQGLNVVRHDFSTGVGAGDPGNGNVNFNNATPASITIIRFDDNAQGLINAEWLYPLLANGDLLTMRNEVTTGEIIIFTVTGPAVDNTGWWEVPVALVSGGIPSNNAILRTTWQQLSQVPAAADPTQLVDGSSNPATVAEGSGITAIRSVGNIDGEGREVEWQNQNGTTRASIGTEFFTDFIIRNHIAGRHVLINVGTGGGSRQRIHCSGDAASGGVTLYAGSAALGRLATANEGVRIQNGTLFLAEQAAQELDDAGFGQLFVDSADDALHYITEAGVDFDLTASPSVTFPLDVPDNDQIRFGTGNDITMDWDGVDFEVEGLAADQIWNWRDGLKHRFYDPTDAQYLEIDPVSATVFNVNLSNSSAGLIFNNANFYRFIDGSVQCEDGLVVNGSIAASMTMEVAGIERAELVSGDTILILSLIQSSGDEFIIRNGINDMWSIQETGGMTIFEDGPVDTDNLNISLDGTDAIFAFTGAADVQYTGGVRLQIFQSASSNAIQLQCVAGQAIIGSTSGIHLEIQHSGVVAIQTQLGSATGNTAWAVINDNASVSHDIGFNDLRVFNDNVSDTLEAGHAGQVAFKDATTARTLTLAAVGDLDFPVGAMTTVINAFATTDYTITEGATTTLFYLDGSTVIDTAGGAVVGPGGVANIWREAAGVYYIWGTGITP